MSTPVPLPTETSDWTGLAVATNIASILTIALAAVIIILTIRRSR